MFYPDNARYAKLAAKELGLEFTDLDHGNGYLFAISGNGRRFLSGAGTVCAYPINNASSYSIARDKSHTKSVLAHHRIRVIPGRHFFLSSDYSKLRNAGHEAADAMTYAAQTGFPVFCKPLRGGRGNYAEPIRDSGELRDYMTRLSRYYDAFLVEPIVSGDEYRVAVFDGKAIYFALKRPAVIRGDGCNTAAFLLGRLNDSLEGTGISPYPLSSVALRVDPGAVLRENETIPLIGRRNLNAFGGIELLHIEVPAALANLAADACRALDLRLGAVDLFDVSTPRDQSELLVIEVNANPGFTAVERLGRLDLVVSLWKSIIIESLEL